MAVTSTYGDGKLLVRTYSRDKEAKIQIDRNMLVDKPAKKQARAAGQKEGLARLKE